MNKLPLIKSINNLTHVETMKSLSVVKNIIEHVMCTRVLGRPIVFHRVHCSIPYCNWQIFCVLVVFSEDGSYGRSFGIEEVPTFSTSKLYTGVPGGKVNILVGHSIGHSKQKCL